MQYHAQPDQGPAQEVALLGGDVLSAITVILLGQ